jgi:hypothetical protein
MQQGTSSRLETHQRLYTAVHKVHTFEQLVIRKSNFVSVVRHLILLPQPLNLFSSQQLFHISQSRSLGLTPLAVFLFESHHHELALLGLDI